MNKNGINSNLINVNNNISNNMNNNSIALNTTAGLQSRMSSTATATANLGPHSPGPPAIPYVGTDTHGAHDMNAEPGTYVHHVHSRISHFPTMHFQLSQFDLEQYFLFYHLHSFTFPVTLSSYCHSHFHFHFHLFISFSTMHNMTSQSKRSR